ncbi:hypothetical protein WMF18_16020 [Sorangium sp. So ce315]|uniref:hypothetical protein n=1 Tax=Sorangium sp. So ce315 TaxID=3133299 RepID=UPI003F5E16F5
MNMLKTITRCAPFFGLVAVALSGCWNESAGPAGPEDTLCEKMAECGELSEGVTTERCAANARLVHDQAGKELAVCEPVFEQLQDLMVCAAQQAGCESAVDLVAAELPAEHPCFDENERYKQALQEVGTKREAPDAGVLCAFHYDRAMGLAATPASGQTCTTSADCPDVECPDPAHGRRGYCQFGKCKTAIDICEVSAPAEPAGEEGPPM